MPPRRCGNPSGADLPGPRLVCCSCLPAHGRRGRESGNGSTKLPCEGTVSQVVWLVVRGSWLVLRARFGATVWSNHVIEALGELREHDLGDRMASAEVHSRCD